MSRIVQVTDSASSHPTSYDSGYAAYSLNNPTRGYKDSGNTSNYSQLNLVRGNGAVSYLYYNFSFDIPSGATITAISCTATCLINRTVETNITTRQIQLYAGSTAKGSASTVVNSTDLMTLDAGSASDWSASDVNNAKIRLYAVRGSVNTTNNYYFRFYGATLNVSYIYDQVQYEVSWNCYNTNDNCGTTTGGLFNPTGSEYFNDGDNVVFQLLTADSLSGKTQLDNGVSMSGSWTNPSTGLYQYQISRIDTDHFIQNYIPYHVTRTSNVSGVTFNSSLPTEYVPGVAAYTEWTGDITNCNLTDNNTDVKSSSATSWNTSGGQYVISNIQADHTIVISSSTPVTRNDIYIKVNGTWKKADTIYAKVGGEWKAVDAVYKKENGSWAVQNDFSAMFDPNGLFVYNS